MKKIIILALVMLSMAQAWAKEPATRFRDKLFDKKSKYVTVVAHRGDWRNSPENSIQAFKSCIEMGVDMGYRVPLFDIEITAQKQSPYSKMSQNELALQFYSAGFFNPQMADQALVCLDMMDFDRKQFIMQKISQNGTMYQQMLMMQQQMLMMAQALDQVKGTNMAEQIAAGITGGAAPALMAGQPGGNVQETAALGGNEKAEASNTKKARQRVAESTSPT